MIILEPHIHMYSRTTDDYQAMYAAGIREKALVVRDAAAGGRAFGLGLRLGRQAAVSRLSVCRKS